MYESNRLNVHLPRVEYRHYLYLSGRIPPSGETRAAEGLPYKLAPQAGYDLPREMRRCGMDRGPQTVEDVIARGYFSVPSGAPETAMISDKKETSWLGLDDLIMQIRNRYQIYDRNMADLAEGLCEAENAIFRQEAAQGCSANDKQRYSRDKRVQDLYEQQREQRINVWRDVTRLRESLPESAQQYVAAHRKLSLLEDRPGDAP